MSIKKDETYQIARDYAQKRANETGFDFGLEWNKWANQWSVWMLPNKKNRSGHELQCEVVSCENLENTRPGHGFKN
jgi:hypothetical protein